MAKKRTAAGETKQFEGMEDNIPEAVQEAAEEYKKALLAANKAKAKLNGAKDHCIDKMVEHGIDRLRIMNGEKVLELETSHKLKLKKPAEPPTAGGDKTVFDEED